MTEVVSLPPLKMVVVKGVFLFRKTKHIPSIPCLIINFEHVFYYNYKLGKAQIERIMNFDELVNQVAHSFHRVKTHEIGEFYLLKDKEDFDSITSYALKTNNSFISVDSNLNLFLVDKKDVSLDKIYKE